MNAARGVRARLRPVRRMAHTAGVRLHSLTPPPAHAPVVVLGHQKSGTTAIAALLARAGGASVRLDLPALWSRDRELGRRPGALGRWIRWHHWYFGFDVVKEPWLTFAPGELAAALPQARFVLVVRDPRDTLRSILDRLDVPGDRADNPPGLDRLAPGWRGLFEDCTRGEHYIDALTERWLQAAHAGEALAGDRLWTIRYEDFVADKAGCIDALSRSLGMESAVDIGALVDHDFQPRGRRRDTSWEAFFGPANLHRITGRAAPGMRLHGYEPGDRDDAP